MSIWNGSFSPLVKHKDGAHGGSVFEHFIGNGGYYAVAENTPLELDTEPISMQPYNGVRTHYPVKLSLPGGGSQYDFFVPADENGHYPNYNEIKEFIDKQLAAKLPYTREPEDMLTEESYLVYASLEDTDWNNYETQDYST